MRSAQGREAPESKFATSLTLAVMSLGYGVVQLDVTIVNTALNSIGTSLGGGVSELQWVVSSYTIAFAAFILTAGALGDRIGAKRVFMAGFAIFTSASLACALASNSAVLIAALGLAGCRGGTTGTQAPTDKLYDVKGKVVAVDAAKPAVTLDHEDIPGLMRAMTMDFHVEDAKLVDGLKAGDQVRGRIKKTESGYIITRLEKP